MDHRIRAFPVEDGGNPRNASDIVRRENDFYIHPFIEDGEPNYMYHLNVQLENSSNEPLEACFDIEWGTPTHMDARYYLLICTGDDEWKYLEEVKTEGTRTIGKGMVPPGTSFLCYQPRYEYGRLLRVADQLPKDIFTIKSIGKTRRKRDILAIEAGNPEKKTVAFYARVHPYETIGNYMIEGMFRWLSDGSFDAKQLLANSHLVFVPMPNTDGVADGKNRVTHGGLNFSANFRHSVEPEAVALKTYFAQQKPEVIFDLHAWMNTWDNLTSNDGKIGRAVYKAILAEEKLFFRPVEIRYYDVAWFVVDHSVNYFASELGVSYFNSSWHHYGRTAADIYAMGVVLLKATAIAAQEGCKRLAMPDENNLFNYYFF